MFRSAKSKLDLGELQRKIKRFADGSFSYRKLLALVCLVIILYILLTLVRNIFNGEARNEGKSMLTLMNSNYLISFKIP